MNPMKHKGTRFLSAAALFAVAGGIALAGGPFEIDAWTIDGGGGRSTGGAFEVIGTIGQFDASGPMTGGNVEARGGFWAAASCPTDLDGNGVTDLGDLNIVLGSFGVSGQGDVTGDGATNLLDLNAVLAVFGNPC
jgi:hypothetical protein